MATSISSEAGASVAWPAGTTPIGVDLRRAILVLGLAASIGLASAIAVTPDRPEFDADLMRLMRGMGLIKGGFAAIAAVVCYWRLARPAPVWRASAYVVGTWMMAASAILVWHMRFLAFATTALHVALLGLVFLALVDEDFFPRGRFRGRSLG